jgi:hypothetical protein
MGAFPARLTLALFLTASVAAPILAEPASGPLVQELTTALTARHLDVFAARDPEAADRFVAALVYPNVQILLVTGRYPVPAALDPLLAAGSYRDVYLAMQSNALPDSKLFIHDMGADGLRVKEKQLADVVYEKVVNQTVLSGNVDDGAYKKRLSDVDAEYARALKILIDALQKTPSPTPTA